jgi:hypothetical protein
MFDDYPDHYHANARLIILKALAEQTDYRLNDMILTSELQRFAINKGRGYLKNQLKWLEQEASAVSITKLGTAVIAELTETGLDHVERRQVLEGVARPSPARG